MTTVTTPASLGLNASVLDNLVSAAREQLQLAGLNSCQIAVARRGRLALCETIGQAGPDSRYAIYSVSKPLLASAFWVLMAEYGLDVRRTVTDFVPEFGANGKQSVTVEQLLLHTAGFPNAVLGPPQWFSRSERVRCMADWSLAWAPGSRCQYHPTSSFWVLAEIIERVTGVDYRDFVVQKICDPLGLDGLRIGVARSDQEDINRVRSVGEPASADDIRAFFGPGGTPAENADHKLLLLMNDPDVRELGVPGGGGVANAGEIALFYQALLHNPQRIWDPGLLMDVTGNVRTRLPDPVSGLAANRTLGLIVQGGDGCGGRRGMGAAQTSTRCFGHHGAGGQLAWADPHSGVSFCFLTDSLDSDSVRVARRGPLLSDLAALSAV